MGQTCENRVYGFVSELSTTEKTKHEKKPTVSGFSVFILCLLVVSLLTATASMVVSFLLYNKLQSSVESLLKLSEIEKAKLAQLEFGNLQLRFALNQTQQDLQTSKENQQALSDSLQNSLNGLDSKLQVTVSDSKQDLRAIAESQRAETGSLERLLEEISSNLSLTTNASRQDLERLSDQVSTFHRSEADISCQREYIRNPYANSCLKLVREPKTWYSAKSSCESAGERLATFETLESQYWFINLRKTRWTTENVWVGGEQFSTSVWRWSGETPTQAHTVIWGTNEPNGENENCMESGSNKDYKFNDAECNRSFYYICERLV